MPNSTSIPRQDQRVGGAGGEAADVRGEGRSGAATAAGAGTGETGPRGGDQTTQGGAPPGAEEAQGQIRTPDGVVHTHHDTIPVKPLCHCYGKYLEFVLLTLMYY